MHGVSKVPQWGTDHLSINAGSLFCVRAGLLEDRHLEMKSFLTQLNVVTMLLKDSLRIVSLLVKSFFGFVIQGSKQQITLGGFQVCSTPKGAFR